VKWKEKCVRSLVGNLKERNRFEKVGLDGKIILKWT
jgi:hypothetical protein